jgi:hypothetical protein
MIVEFASPGSKAFAGLVFQVWRRLHRFRLSGSQKRAIRRYLVNEFHAGGFEALSHNLKCCATGLMCAGLELTNGHDANSGLVGEFLLTLVEQTERRLSLGRSDARAIMSGTLRR